MAAMPEEYIFMEGLVTQLALLMCHLVSDAPSRAQQRQEECFFEFFACLATEIILGHATCSFESLGIQGRKKFSLISDVMQGSPVFVKEEELPSRCLSLLKRHFVYHFCSEPLCVKSYDIADFVGERNRGRRERFVSRMDHKYTC